MSGEVHDRQQFTTIMGIGRNKNIKKKGLIEGSDMVIIDGNE